MNIYNLHFPSKVKSLSKLFSKRRVWMKGRWRGYRKGSEIIDSTYDQANCFCLEGALNFLEYSGRISYNKSNFKRARLNKAIKELFPDRAFSGIIVSFNDHKKTTFKDVLKVIKKARV